MDRVKTFLKINNMSFYTSYTFIDLNKSQIYYNQVKDFSFQSELSEQENSELIQNYGDFYLEHLFQKYPDKKQLSATIHPDIRKLYDYDSEYQTEFLSTLRTYLKHNRNVKKTADELHIHKSTFFYRIGKIEDLFGISLKDADKLFAYEFSLRLIDFLK